MKKIFIITTLVLSFAFAEAQTNNELQSLIKQSFGYFPRVQELQKASELSEIKVAQARSGYLPTIAGTGTYSYINPLSKINLAPIGLGEVKMVPNNNYNFNVSLNQTIWDFGKTQAQISKAKSDLLSSSISVEQAKAQVAAQVANVYYSMIYLKKAIAVEDSLLAFLNENKRIVQSRINRGDALQIDLTNIQSNIDLEENRKVDFINQLQKQKALMEYSVGSSTEPTAIDFDFPIFNETSPSDYAKQNNFDLRLATQKTLSSEMDLKYAQNSRFPLLSFSGSTGYKNGYQPNINPLIYNYSLGLNLSVPIYSAGKTNQNIHIAQRTVESNQLALKTAENNLRRDLAQVQADLSSNQERIENSASQVQYAQEALQLTEKRYLQGVATHLDLLNSSSNLQKILLSQIQFQYQLCLARVEQARLMGWKYWGEN